ncbi:MAG: peptidase U32 family protein [Desulfobacterales bacterium]
MTDNRMEAATADARPPAILAPAGSRASFLAALAAGAEAIYCGLKAFSARMEAKNFSLDELADLTGLAHAKGARVFVTLNALIKPDELDVAGRLLDQLNRHVRPDALIVQDLAMAGLVRQTGFVGEVVWSTLANVSFPEALSAIRARLPVDSVVLPRELTVDEIRTMAAACPPGLGLEVFVQGALCYGVSGRCYWSSFLGGRSGLRGRCVQPCRRVYAQGGEQRRYFSCRDLNLDVLVKVLLTIPRIRAWKIEGRKKGPHYVYYTVAAYRMLRDHPGDSRMKKAALDLLARALGRPGTHYHFLSQRPQNPVDTRDTTGSGLLIGRVKGGGRTSFFNPSEELLKGDLLRVGYEDEPGHGLERIGRAVPRGGRHFFSASARPVPKGTAVFLIDRREKALDDLIRGLEAEMPQRSPPRDPPALFQSKLPAPYRGGMPPRDLRVCRHPGAGGEGGCDGLWLSAAALSDLPERSCRQTRWWLPPVIFPSDAEAIRALVAAACARGGRSFVLNDPWQVGLFDSIGNRQRVWAGPFCNLANPLALETAAALGFEGAIVSPELGDADLLALPRSSPLPLGVVIGGNWPLCVARSAAAELKLDAPFRSPKGEEAWTVRHGPLMWVYPNWRLDLQDRRGELERAGYRLFVQLVEPLPDSVKLKQRPGRWNWDMGLQ